MKVKKLGSYLDVDSEGYLINPTSVDKLQEDWLPVVEEVKQKYIEHFGGDLISVYVRGSVAKGEAIDDISDVDTFAVVACRKEDIDLSWRDVFEKRMIKKHPHIVGIEIGALPVDALPELRAGKIMIKTQSVCIYGKELTDEIDPLKPGKETVQHVWSIGREITETKGWLSEPHTDEEIRTKCAWIMKRLLRTGFELVMERSQKYTRDLYLCYEGFAEYYPEKESEMYEVLELAISPTVDEKRILNILSTTGDWIASEVENIFDIVTHMKLDVPLIQQRAGSYHCQIATLLMVMAYFGDEVEYDELLADLEPYILENGMHNQGAITYLRKRGYQTFFAHHELGVLSHEIENISEKDVTVLEDFLEQIPNDEENDYRREKIGLDIEYIRAGGTYSTKLPTFQLVDTYLEKDIPVVLGSVKNRGLALNPTAGNANHAVVVVGKEGDEYLLNDPSPNSAGQYTIHRDRLLHAWYSAGVNTRVAWK